MRRAQRQFRQHFCDIRPAVPGLVTLSIGVQVCKLDGAQINKPSINQDIRDPLAKLSPETSAITADPSKVRLMQRLKKTFRRWWRSVGEQFRAMRRAGYLLCLFSPVAVAYPIAQATKGAFPKIENVWWDFVLWSIQQASPTIIKFTQWASSR